MQVRPSFVEASLRRTPVRARASDHLLVAYKAALLAVLQAQLDDRGFRDGMQVPQAGPMLHHMLYPKCCCIV